MQQSTDCTRCACSIFLLVTHNYVLENSVLLSKALWGYHWWEIRNFRYLTCHLSVVGLILSSVQGHLVLSNSMSLIFPFLFSLSLFYKQKHKHIPVAFLFYANNASFVWMFFVNFISIPFRFSFCVVKTTSDLLFLYYNQHSLIPGL